MFGVCVLKHKDLSLMRKKSVQSAYQKDSMHSHTGCELFFPQLGVGQVLTCRDSWLFQALQNSSNGQVYSLVKGTPSKEPLEDPPGCKHRKTHSIHA